MIRSRAAPESPSSEPCTSATSCAPSRRCAPSATLAPTVEVTLISLPWAESFAGRFAAYVDDFLPFPGYQGLEGDAPWEFESFQRQARARHFDLAVQLHGDGRISNHVVARLGSTSTAGFRPPGTPENADMFSLPYPSKGSEVARCLALITALGGAETASDLEFPLSPQDRDELDAAFDGRDALRMPYACIHAGAKLPSRRWPANRFAAVGDALTRQGLKVVLTGTRVETGLVSEVQTAMAAPALNLAGATTLGALGALVSDAAVVVSNDTGVSHLAAALRRPSVVVSCGSDPERWAPPDRRLHRTLAARVPCRPCAYETCPIGHTCAVAVRPEEVVAKAMEVARLDPACS